MSIEKDWITAAGLRAVVCMHPSLGHRCGYVAVPAGHPLHGAAYNVPCAALKPVGEDEPLGKRGVIPALCASMTEPWTSPELVFDVHGGITFSDDGDDGYPAEGDGFWWFGYDCGHAGDAPDPESESGQWRTTHGFDTDGVFRSLDYCMSECESLARQIVEKVVV